MAQTLGRYILERTIAVGGMGEVFHARQTGPDGFDRTCVVKTMHPNLTSNPELVDLFLEEARLTARLTHPHIAQVYDFGKIDTAYYIAMELVDGPSLHTVIKAFATRAKKLPISTVLRIVSQAAQALDYVHKLKGPDGAPLNLVHRDISPGNLLLSKDGLVKLIDFGIAKARTTQRQTAMGQIRGKLAYMSPEQMLGMPLDGRTDIYSLGLVLYELLSGRRANPGRNEVEILSSVKTATLAPIESLRDDCPKSLAKVLERATARDKAVRYTRAGDFGQALEQALIEVGVAVGPNDLTAVAEETELVPARPSPAAPAPSRGGGVATQTGAIAAPGGAPTSVEVKLDTVTTSKAAGPLPRTPLLLAAAALVVLGGGAGAFWAAMSRETPKPAEEKTVIVTPPPDKPVEPPPAVAALLPPEHEAAAPVPAPAPAAPPRPSKSRWAKSEKFEREPAPTPQKDPAPVPEPAPQPPPAPATTGAVQVTSDPPTEIFVDGRAAGVTPSTLELQPGPHKVELREPRLNLSLSRTIDVSAGAKESLQWRPGHGLLDVRPVPPHVELQIAVDGIAVGTTPLSAVSVWEGNRKVSAHNTATGWKAEKSIEVPSGGRVRIKVNDGAGIEVVAR